MASGQGSSAADLATRGLKVPQKQRPRGRLWLNDGSRIRLRPERANHVWSYDFVSGKTHDGRTLRMLTLIEEYTRECLAIRVARRLGRYEVIEALAEVMLFRGIPENIRSDNGPEFFIALASEYGRYGYRRITKTAPPPAASASRSPSPVL